MKKLGFVVGGGILLTLLCVAPVLAGSELPEPHVAPGVVTSTTSPPPSVTQPPDVPGEVAGPPASSPHEVLGRTVRPPSGLAFTGAGATVRLWMVLAAALVIAGLTLLIATRRLRRSEAE